MRQIIFYSIIFFAITHGTLNNAYAQTQILNDEKTLQSIRKVINHIYNIEFEKADSLMYVLERKLPDYPGMDILKAFYITWKHRPLKKDTDAFAQFENHLLDCISRSEALLEKDENNVEALFFLMASHGYLAQLYVDNGSKLKALGEAKTAYKYVKDGFDLMEKYPDFYFSSGIYNYYREKYPEEHPFFKSFIWFFRSGDKEEGLSMLKKGSKSALFTRVECYAYLFHIYTNYENKPFEAIHFSEHLNHTYPNNPLYKSYYAENLLRVKKFDQAKPLITNLQNSHDAYYQYLGAIFAGIYYERSVGNLEQAKKNYLLADKLGSQNEEIRIPHYDSMLFLGLGRVNQKSGNPEKAKDDYKRAIKEAEFSYLRTEAEVLLKRL